MNNIRRKLQEQLRKPLPVIINYVWAKLLSVYWQRGLAAAGKGFYVSSGTRILGGDSIKIGSNFHAGESLWLEAVKCQGSVAYSPCIGIGSDVDISEFVHIAATTNVTIGNGVLFGSHVHVTDHSHGTYTGIDQDSPFERPITRALSKGRPVTIGDNVWLGDGVVVLPGVTIGAGSIIGANSVVSKSLPANVLAVGSPARPIKMYDCSTGVWQPIDNGKLERLNVL